MLGEEEEMFWGKDNKTLLEHFPSKLQNKYDTNTLSDIPNGHCNL